MKAPVNSRQITVKEPLEISQKTSRESRIQMDSNKDFFDFSYFIRVYTNLLKRHRKFKSDKLLKLLNNCLIRKERRNNDNNNTQHTKIISRENLIKGQVIPMLYFKLWKMNENFKINFMKTI